MGADAGYSDKINNILGIDESYKAPARIMEILFDKGIKEQVFTSMLEMANYDMSYDWFHQYFSNEHADRAKHKQDFTPMSIANLMTALVQPDGIAHDTTAGTGGLLISAWDAHRRKYDAFSYDPLSFWVIAEDVSDRAIPFLLLNLAIRGINGNVVHCDSLTRECKGAYLVLNTGNDYMGFSDIYKTPPTKDAEKMLNVKFVKQQEGAAT